MKIFPVAFRSLNGGLSHRFNRTQTHLLRSFSSWSFSDNGAVNPQSNKSESHEDFEKRIFGEIPGSDSKTDAFFDKLSRLGRTHDRSSLVDGGSSHNKSESHEDFEKRIFGEIPGSDSKTDAFFDKLSRLGRTHDRSSPVDGGSSQMMNDLEDGFDTLSDGMDGKLMNAARYFEFDPEEVMKEDYAFRYDTDFYPGSTYTLKNVRFLANFITEAGILIKRSKTGISAKAQRKVAREIKTARAFGLMPFTTMGTKSFVYGVTMENLDKDFAYASFDRNMHDEPDM